MNRRRFNVDISSITSKTKFWRNSKSFPRTFSVYFRWSKYPRRFHVLFLVKFLWSKNPRGFNVPFSCNFNARKIHVVHTFFFDVISVVEISTLFPRTFFHVLTLAEISNFFRQFWWPRNPLLFARTFFDEISMVKSSTSFLVSCKLTKIFK